MSAPLDCQSYLRGSNIPSIMEMDAAESSMAETIAAAGAAARAVAVGGAAALGGAAEAETSLS